MTLLVVHAATTWFMVGLIWTVQLVHYPLFASVGKDSFNDFEARHTRRIGALLTIPAPAEIATGAALVWSRPTSVPLWLVLASGAALAVIWVMTALVHAPLHSRLSREPEPGDVDRLVRSNWWRTGLWTARGAAVATMLAL